VMPLLVSLGGEGKDRREREGGRLEQALPLFDLLHFLIHARGAGGGGGEGGKKEREKKKKKKGKGSHLLPVLQLLDFGGQKREKKKEKERGRKIFSISYITIRGLRRAGTEEKRGKKKKEKRKRRKKKGKEGRAHTCTTPALFCNGSLSYIARGRLESKRKGRKKRKKKKKKERE